MLGSSAPFDITQATAFLSEFLKVLGAAFFTVFTFVAGQIFMKFAEPTFELRKEIGTIATCPKNRTFSRLVGSFTACRAYNSQTRKSGSSTDRMPPAYASESFWKSAHLRTAKRHF